MQSRRPRMEKRAAPNVASESMGNRRSRRPSNPRRRQPGYGVEPDASRNLKPAHGGPNIGSDVAPCVVIDIIHGVAERAELQQPFC